MAVEKIVTGQTFVLKTVIGTDNEGNPMFGRQSFGNVRAVAVPADIYAVATALADLQEYPIDAVELREYSNLVEIG